MVSRTYDFASQVIASSDVSWSDYVTKNALLKYIMAFPMVLKIGFVFNIDIGMFKGEDTEI